MDWRRKDSTYAAATAVAAAFVAYIVAGNFGLLPSPLSPVAIGAGTSVGVAPLGLAAAPTATTTAGVVPTATPGQTPTSTEGPTAAPGDTVPPSGAFTTPTGLVAPVTEPAIVSGTASDAASGVGSVTVTFDPDAGASTTTTADLSCNKGRSSCTWSADVPAAVGSYTVTARVADRVGNTRDVGPISVTIVDGGGVVDDLLNDADSLLSL